MNPKEARRLDRRLEKIFAAVAQGKLAHETDAQLTRDERRGTRAQERGMQSESHVAHILKQYPFVDRIKRRKPMSPADRAGTDLTIYFLPEKLDLLITSVDVQVKSSNRRIIMLKKDIAKRHHFAYEQVNNWLARQGLILLNGRLSDDRIKTEFERQLQQILTYKRNPKN